MSVAALKTWSLRRTLLMVLLGLTLALWAGSAAIVYVEARRESQELFDQSLTETGHLLLSLVEKDVREHGLTGPIDLPLRGQRNPHQYLLFKVRDARQRVLYRNDAASDIALSRSAPDGLSWTTIGGQRWRLFSLWDPQRTLQLLVAEPTSHRDDISRGFFYRIALFGLLLAALAAIAIWWSIHRVFRVLQASAGEVSARTPDELADVRLAGAPAELHPLLLEINRLFGRVRHSRDNEQRFTADAAHELRTPLAAIKTNLQVLQRARSGAEREEFIAALGASVERATRLVNQLLALARLDPQSQEPRLAPGDLAALLEEQGMQWREWSDQHQLSLTVSVAPAPCALDADSLRMLLRNLVENALRYTPAPGGVVVSCGVQDGRSYLRVADTGPGIAEELHERAFERFVRLGGAQLPGSGLGLSIVRRIAERHGAQIVLGLGLQGRGLAVTLVFPAT
ncbi:ATP-binding protein [Janthinobacterium sp. GW458P]|uniref:sensor histidine kinase n=1 Tax=Janthinobacterium sp. GW458P TaxID=1981504 RepID=UPI000A3239FD|nr:ATP-binding protein [Janthinobacterium sp. GW458P]MBE3028030.1 sensor histidine kinase N-terminal domain-containing protein [Janthinobacterium sp. GW458P]